MPERDGTLFDRLLAFFRDVPARDAPGVWPPPVAVSGDGFVDVELGLRRLRPEWPPRFRLEAVTDRGQIGFEVVLGDFSASEIGPGIPIWPGVLQLRSIGAASDAFLALLDEQYGTGRRPRRMRSEVRATAIVLEGDPNHPEQGLRIKLFFEEQGELEELEDGDDDEGPRPGTPEVYLNLEPRRGRGSWSEKDEGYRSDLVFVLTEPETPR